MDSRNERPELEPISPKPDIGETQPLLDRSPPTSNTTESQSSTKLLSTRHAFSILVSLQIGSGIFASPAQVDSNVPSPGAALLVWVAGGLLSWTGAASFAELGASLPLNGGMQEYLRYIYGDTMAFLMSWIYIMAVKPSSMAIQSIVIAESIASVLGGPTPAAEWVLKLMAITALFSMVLINSINTKTTMRLNESFAVIKMATVALVVAGGLTAFLAHLINSKTSLSGSKDWFTRNWFQSRPTVSEGHTIDWSKLGAWDMLGHYSAALYAGLWAYDGWDNANFVASEIRDPGRSLPRAIKAAMTVVLSCFELVNVAYYILLPWDTLSANDAVAVSAAKSLLGRRGGILITILVAISCAGSITSNLFSVGRLTVAAAQRHYLPAFLSGRGFPTSKKTDNTDLVSDNESSVPKTPPKIIFDAPLPANVLGLFLTSLYILLGSFHTLLLFVGMAEWVFYVSTVVGLLVLRRREPSLDRPFKPNIVVPGVFVVVGTLVIARSAVFAPVQSLVLGSLLGIGGLVGWVRR
ncbi:amino acid transporter [Delitschia confertaspora ATCC 74209]|uniref:Amino acid transporter n=1 Tax=Delitschia confertaspora ATCC 74209 TaxID=1513339 RepID=A0A9P4JKE1_9PLEO|nr:amino acid transporter [Delitschia confertaspora ATCC 74209]